jgi:hypothetical protein
VTLQIAAICDSGWALASDRAEQIGRIQSSITKIFTDTELRLTYAICGSTAIARFAAQELATGLRSESWPAAELLQQYRLEEIGNRAWVNASDIIKSERVGPDPSVAGLTVFFHDTPTIGWALYIGQKSVTQSFSERRVRADHTNPAVFFIEKYYSFELLPKQLAYLAAHTICTAPYFNKSGIGGLDVTVCEKIGGEYKIKELTKEEVDALKQRSKQFDRKISGHFGER